VYRTDSVAPPAPSAVCRRRSVDDAIAEILRLKRLAGGSMKFLCFDDDELMMDLEWLARLTTRIRDEVGLPYVMMGNVRRVSDAVARLLEETGCLLVKFGVESGSERIRKEILRRSRSVSPDRTAFRVLRRHGVSTRAYVLIGAPTETPAELEATFALCGEMEADSVRPAYLQPYPGTRIHEYCVEHGLLQPGRAATSYFAGSELTWPAREALLLEKTLFIFPWLTSAARPGSPVAAEYRAVADEVIAMSRAEWDRDTARRWVRETTLRLDRAHRERGAPHHLAPFPDRPDTSFLVGLRRRYPFVNVDECWPPDAPWADRPVPAPVDA